MPFGDRTGPLGQGPRSGRGAGRCAGSMVPGTMNRSPERGFGGGGRRWRNRFCAKGLLGWQRAAETATIATPAPLVTLAPEQEIAVLKGQAESLQTTLNQTQKRIEELEAKPKQE